MIKSMAINKEQFENMFTETQKEEIKSTLKAYDKVHVTYEYGKYHFSTFVGLTASYADDHRFCGTVYADDIFTPEECIINYVEAFHDYPIGYHGKRDYKMLREVGNDWTAKFQFVNGNIVRA